MLLSTLRARHRDSPTLARPTVHRPDTITNPSTASREEEGLGKREEGEKKEHEQSSSQDASVYVSRRDTRHIIPPWHPSHCPHYSIHVMSRGHQYHIWKNEATMYAVAGTLHAINISSRGRRACYPPPDDRHAGACAARGCGSGLLLASAANGGRRAGSAGTNRVGQFISSRVVPFTGYTSLSE